MSDEGRPIIITEAIQFLKNRGWHESQIHVGKCNLCGGDAVWASSADSLAGPGDYVFRCYQCGMDEIIQYSVERLQETIENKAKRIANLETQLAAFKGANFRLRKEANEANRIAEEVVATVAAQPAAPTRVWLRFDYNWPSSTPDISVHSSPESAAKGGLTAIQIQDYEVLS